MNDPLYRLTFDAPELLRAHPPRLKDSHKKALLDLAYPDRQAAAGAIEVTRWAQQVQEPLALQTALAADVQPNFYDYKAVAAPEPCAEWHVNFADPSLFTAYASGLFAQDEMQVVEHPLLGSVREALRAMKLPAKTEDENGATPILIQNVERRLEVATNPDAAAGRPGGLYGNRFAQASLDAVSRATRVIDPPTHTNLIAMAAPACSGGDYTTPQITSIFATAFTAFAAARQESTRAGGPSCRSIVHTGFWGCGAFGGNRTIMIALQALAARAAGIASLVLHAGDLAGVEDARRGLEVAEQIAAHCGNPCMLDTLAGRVAMLGYRWGVSDGN